MLSEEEEIFGFERLQEVIQGSKSETAEALLEKIMDRVKGFVGNAPQHDDITVIVVSVGE